MTDSLITTQYPDFLCRKEHSNISK